MGPPDRDRLISNVKFSSLVSGELALLRLARNRHAQKKNPPGGEGIF
jgi:hypothetical protein